jgi:hypothetical protein
LRDPDALDAAQLPAHPPHALVTIEQHFFFGRGWPHRTVGAGRRLPGLTAADLAQLVLDRAVGQVVEELTLELGV